MQQKKLIKTQQTCLIVPHRHGLNYGLAGKQKLGLILIVALSKTKRPTENSWAFEFGGAV